MNKVQSIKEIYTYSHGIDDQICVEDELFFDSLSFITFISLLEDEFNIVIPLELCVPEKFVSIKDIEILLDDELIIKKDKVPL